MIRFDGLVVLVTGAGRGLGAAYAHLFARRGARVVVHDAGVNTDGTGGDRSVAEAVVDAIRSAGGDAYAAFDDFARRGAARKLVTSTFATFGRLDALVHSAGIVTRGAIPELDHAVIDRTVEINGRAAVDLLATALPAMAIRGYGRVVLTVSGHGLYPNGEPDLVAYAVSKQMQFGLLNAVAGYYRERGVLVNAISPVAATRMATQPRAPGTFLTEDVAPAVAYLASDRCAVAGVVVRAANGKFSIGRYAVTDGVDLGDTRPIEPEQIEGAWNEIARGPLSAP